MSRVTYILGAGASYGERKKDKDGNVIGFTRGLPIVNELETALQFLRDGEPTTSVRFPVEEAKKWGVSLEDYKNVCHKLSLLKQACASYPTIDTLAKQLFVTGRSFDASPKDQISYDDLKRYLTTALLMLQDEKKRDLRYDGFIASLIDKNRNFPNMTILSWNYDVQFEMAYSGYFTDYRYIPSLWKALNVYNKKYPTEFNVDAPFAMVKLNGTALFTDASKNEWEVNGKKVNNDETLDGYGEYYTRNRIKLSKYPTLYFSHSKETDMQMRIYDKERELNTQSPHKAERLKEWIGWDNMNRIYRVEITWHNTNVREVVRNLGDIVEEWGEHDYVLNLLNMSDYRLAMFLDGADRLVYFKDKKTDEKISLVEVASGI